jgi:hypothetical protein
MKRIIFALVLALPSMAYAQVQPSGTFTPGHAMRVLNSAGTAVGDAGGSAGSSKNGQNYLTEIGITNTGTPLCVNDALTNAASGYHQLCLGANALGGGLISYNAYGGASALPFNFNLNGTTVPFPGTGNGNVIGPTSPVGGANDLAIWNGSGVVIKDASTAFPSSFSTTPTDMAQINIGSYPLASQIPSGVLEGLVSKVVVPSSYTASPWPNTAISAYILNGNPTNNGSGVSVFSFAGTTHDGAVAFGLNPVVGNCDNPAPTNGCGVDGGGWIGEEIDVNVMKKGGSTPIGEAKGLVIVGGSEISPANSSFALDIFPLGTGVPWTHGLVFEDGATSGAAIELNQLAAGNNSASQFLTFKSTSSVPVTAFTQMQQTADGVLRFGGPQVVKVAFNVGSNQTLDTGAVALFNGPSADETLEIRAHNGLSDGMLISSSTNDLMTSKGLELIGSTIQLTGNVKTTGTTTFGNPVIFPTSTTGAVTPAFTNAPTSCSNVIWIGPLQVTSPSQGSVYLAACHT